MECWKRKPKVFTTAIATDVNIVENPSFNTKFITCSRRNARKRFKNEEGACGILSGLLLVFSRILAFLLSNDRYQWHTSSVARTRFKNEEDSCGILSRLLRGSCHVIISRYYVICSRTLLFTLSRDLISGESNRLSCKRIDRLESNRSIRQHLAAPLSLYWQRDFLLDSRVTSGMSVLTRDLTSGESSRLCLLTIRLDSGVLDMNVLTTSGLWHWHINKHVLGLPTLFQSCWHRSELENVRFFFFFFFFFFFAIIDIVSAFTLHSILFCWVTFSLPVFVW